jgi:hypothetical protein
LRRKLIICTALVVVLVGASVAYAATLNNYTAKLTFTSTKAGTKAKPVPIGYTETLTAANATPGKVAAPLVDIKTTMYGVVSNLKDFPTCSYTKIYTPPKYNLNCPKGSEVATGKVNSELGGPTLLAADAGPCNPDLVVYNAGGGKEWYFFTAVGTQCGSLHTGSTKPYPGTVKQSGKNLVINVPLPSFVSTAVAGQEDLYGSLTKEVVTTKPLSIKVHGKKVYSQVSVACKGKTRPYSVSFTAVPAAGSPGVMGSKSGSAKC